MAAHLARSRYCRRWGLCVTEDEAEIRRVLTARNICEDVTTQTRRPLDVSFHRRVRHWKGRRIGYGTAHR